MEIRELTREELVSLPAAFYEDTDKMGNGTRFTPDTVVRVAGAFDGEKMVGAWVMSLQVHCAPMWVAPELRGQSRGIRKGMWEKVAGFVRETGSNVAFMTQMENAPQVGGILKGLDARKVGTLYQVEV